MKKALSTALAASLVVSSFASVAFAAETAAPATTQEKYDALFALKIFEGDETGANLGGDMTRAQLAKIITLVKGLTEDASAATYTDLDGASWAKGYIGAVTKAGIFDGVAEGQFDPSGKVTLEQLAKVLVKVLGLTESTDAVSGTVSDWAKGYVAAAVKAGLLSETDYTVNATRGEFVDATYTAVTAIQTALAVTSAKAIDANTVEFTLSNGTVITKKLDTALVPNAETEVSVTFLGKELKAKVTLVGSLALSKAEAVGASKVAVTFTAAVDTTKAEFTLKKGTRGVGIDEVEFNDAKTVATLTLADEFQDEKYTLTVDGLGLATKTVEFEATEPEVTSLELKGEILAISAEAEIEFVVKNQYGEEIEDAEADDFNWIYSTAVVGDTAGVVDLDDATIEEGDSLTVTVVADNGVKTSKTYKIGAAAVVTKLTLKEVVLGEDEERLEVGDKATITFEAEDQYGNEVTDTDLLADVKFIDNWRTGDFVADPAAAFIENDDEELVIEIDTDGVTAGSYLLNAVTTGGTSSSIKLEVVDPAEVDTVKLTAPTGIVADGDADVEVVITAKDQFGNDVDAEDIVDAYEADPASFKFFDASSSVSLNDISIALNDDDQAVVVIGEVVGDGKVTLTVAAPSGETDSVSFDVEEARVADSIKIEDAGAGKLLYEATTEVEVVVLDQYGEEVAADDADVEVEVTIEGPADEDVGLTGATTITDESDIANIVLTAGTEDAGSYKVKLELVVDGETVNTKTLTKVVTDGEDDDVLTYSVADIAPLYKAGGDGYDVEVEVTAKDKNGVEVAIPASAISSVKASNDKVTVDGATIVGSADIEDDATVIVTIVLDTPQGKKVVTKTVTVSGDDLEAQSIVAKAGDDEVTEVAVEAGTAIADLFAENDDLYFEVKDQFGGTSLTTLDGDLVNIIITDSEGNDTNLADGDAATFTFDFTGDVDSYTVIAITSNGKQVTVKVTKD